MTPFEALYGRPPPTIPFYCKGSSPVEAVDQSLIDRDTVLQHLKCNLASANNRMKQLADKKRHDVQFQVGDKVFIKLQPYRQHFIFRRAFQKLSCKFFGHFEVLERVEPVAYRLQFPAEARIHPVVYNYHHPLFSFLTQILTNHPNVPGYKNS